MRISWMISCENYADSSSWSPWFGNQCLCHTSYKKSTLVIQKSVQGRPLKMCHDQIDKASDNLLSCRNLDVAARPHNMSSRRPADECYSLPCSLPGHWLHPPERDVIQIMFDFRRIIPESKTWLQECYDRRLAYHCRVRGSREHHKRHSTEAILAVALMSGPTHLLFDVRALSTKERLQASDRLSRPICC